MFSCLSKHYIKYCKTMVSFQDIDMTLNSQRVLHTSPSWMNYGVVWSVILFCLEKQDHVIIKRFDSHYFIFHLCHWKRSKPSRNCITIPCVFFFSPVGWALNMLMVIFYGMVCKVIPMILKPKYSRRARSLLWLLMPWQCKSTMVLTHWGQEIHIRISKLSIIGSDNGL